MSNVVVLTEKLSKLYHITGRRAEYQTLSEGLANAASAPFRAVASAFRRRNRDGVGQSDNTV